MRKKGEKEEEQEDKQVIEQCLLDHLRHCKYANRIKKFCEGKRIKIKLNIKKGQQICLNLHRTMFRFDRKLPFVKPHPLYAYYASACSFGFVLSIFAHDFQLEFH